MDLVGTISSISFTQPVTFGRRHYSLLYGILCASPWRLHPNVTFPWDSCCPKLWTLITFSKQIYFESARKIFYNL
jgi:hypothetical protein